MEKMHIKDFLSETPEKQQEYMKEIIEQEQLISELPEEIIPKNKNNLVVVQIKKYKELFRKYINDEKDGNNTGAAFIRCNCEKDVSFFIESNKSSIMPFYFDSRLQASMYGHIYLCEYKIDVSECKEKDSKRGGTFYDGIPMKLTIISELAENYEGLYNITASKKAIKNYESEKIRLHEETERFKEIISEKKSELNEELETLRKTISEQTAELNDSINKLNEEKSELTAEINGMKEIAEKFGVDIYKKDIAESSDNSQNPMNYPEMVKHIHNYLSNKEMYYDYDVINSFASGLLTNQIIILSGDSGTGKSSLPVVFAKAIGARQRLISVQPSWTDNQDLLGFFDFSKGCFVPTPFMDVLVEADRNPDTIYIVCLDEMNLVRVEYYFSEILSAMESPDKKLRLYSKYLFDENMDELKHKIPALCNADNKFIMRIIKSDDFRTDAYGEEHSETLRKIKRLCRYPYEFSIPENIQFVGTLNMDETTKSLSPKVLDRSFVIEVGISDSKIPDGEPAEKLNYSFSDYMALSKAEDTGIMNKIQNLCRNIKNAGIKGFEISLSRRNEKNINQLISKNGTPDYIFMGKILPSVRGKDITEDNFKLISDIIKRELSEKVTERFSKMYDKEFNEISFWR